MDKLSKTQKDEFATAFAILALYDGGAEVSSNTVASLLEATGNDEVEAFYPIIFTSYLNTPEKIAKLVAVPSAGGGGGGGGSGGGGGGGGEAAEAEEEEKVEEEEMAAPAMDMFGAGDGGGGDY